MSANTTRRARARVEFGDFQTPPALAREVCSLLADTGVRPRSLLEPTCGLGSFLLAGLERFPGIGRAVALDINADHVAALRQRIASTGPPIDVEVAQQDFFRADWSSFLDRLPEPLLVLGNPPWVTNAAVGALGGSNLPKKSNFQNHSGIEALTGKSNFDISEAMLIQLARRLDGREATLAMLCKTTVARKVLSYAWKHNLRLRQAETYPVDVQAQFGVSVEACLLVADFHSACRADTAVMHESFRAGSPGSTIGYRDGLVVADLSAYDRWRHLRGEDDYRWRSGVKHDCSRVMELRKEGDRYLNGLGELVELEEDFLFPMLKGSEVASEDSVSPSRWMLVPQRAAGESTAPLRHQAPRTWRYLEQHAELLDRRASAVYRGQPRFSVFGVGPYSFQPWKVAVSSLYKRLKFRVIGPFRGKPVVFDDTSCFLSCEEEEEARLLHRLLESEPAHDFYQALVFWDAKRPLTIEVLDALDLSRLRDELNRRGTTPLPLLATSKREPAPSRQYRLFAQGAAIEPR